MYQGIFFQKEPFMGGGGTFYQKIFSWGNFLGNLWGGVVVHGGTYDQIMSREGRAL